MLFRSVSQSRYLVVGIWIQNDGDVLTGITYNSVAMTLMTKAAVGSDYLYLYYLTNPSTGANTVNATRTGSAANGFNVFASSYYSAKQIGQPDNTNSASSLSLTLAANSGDWIVTMGRATGGNLTSGTNNTVRGSLSSNRFGDGNGAVTSGNQTVTFVGVISLLLSSLFNARHIFTLLSLQFLPFDVLRREPCNINGSLWVAYVVRVCFFCMGLLGLIDWVYRSSL